MSILKSNGAGLRIEFVYDNPEILTKYGYELAHMYNQDTQILRKTYDDDATVQVRIVPYEGEYELWAVVYEDDKFIFSMVTTIDYVDDVILIDSILSRINIMVLMNFAKTIKQKEIVTKGGEYGDLYNISIEDWNKINQTKI